MAKSKMRILSHVFLEKKPPNSDCGLFLILSLITISIVGYTTFSQARTSLKESLFERLSFAAKLKENELNRWILDRRKKILAIAELPEINNQAKILLTSKNLLQNMNHLKLI